ncbi:uncharacterized protein FFE2_03396 [Fusarium fujikuroi]|nr:uncharacterized protein FFE2_03396 [Fusarium fujikuroi]
MVIVLTINARDVAVFTCADLSALMGMPNLFRYRRPLASLSAPDVETATSEGIEAQCNHDFEIARVQIDISNSLHGLSEDS